LERTGLIFAVGVNGPARLGQLISVTGRVTDEDGSPASGVVMELWQANAAGKYVHEMDDHIAPIDPNFFGQGRLVADEVGRYQAFTIKPGAYPVLSSGWWWRPPHIHFVFSGAPDKVNDPVLQCIPNATLRRRLFANRNPSLDAAGLPAYRCDIILRGEGETPFFMD
jgi:protocatechuate 3,4-dioxygenase beta subunit